MAETTQKKIAEGADNCISAEVRTQFGKGAARKLRAVGKIPAVHLRPRHRPAARQPCRATRSALILRSANAILDARHRGQEASWPW